MAQRDSRNRSLILLITALIAALIAAILSVMTIFTTNVVVEATIAAATCVTVALYLFSFRPQDDTGQIESRERVRAAEQGLENALRGRASVGAANTEEPKPPTTAEASASGSQEDAQTRLALSELWAVTHSRLDHYHGIALGQAKQSFRNAQVAMGLGFTLLVGFVIVALNASTTAGSVVAGGLGAVSAALAGYVSRTFIRSQEAAAGHLRAYFDQPLEFSRYLAAERLMADARLSEEKRAEILSTLVQTMIAGPAEPASTSPDEPQTSP
ncbi:hypothetical protein ACH4L5_03065 [Streptomyces sp. NPDC017405]|uniref:hypothetical protein n=1 Tax=unclassified Streptomyces TaxID=2593676 RepID=UPI0037B1E565